MLARTLNDARPICSTRPSSPCRRTSTTSRSRRPARRANWPASRSSELLHEPTAAAIYYSWVENHGDATYLVYDLGGGTFDVSVIRRRLDDYEVLSVSGDPFLGGDDFDRLLASHLIERRRRVAAAK